jgi:hypothetical protein
MSIQVEHFRRLAVPVAMLIVGLCFIGQLTLQSLVKTLDDSSSSVFTETSTVHVQQTSLPRDSANDWFQVDRFESEPFLKNSCTFVENICHSTGQWWYDESDPLARQPEFTLRTELRGAPGYPETIHVRASDDKRMSHRTCPFSPSPNHLVLHGMHNHMLDQFYLRLLAGLSELVRTQVDEMVDFLRQTQLYLHLYEKNDKPLQDSHHIFTDAFRARQLHDFKSLLQNSGCMCHKRLILCGYEEKDDGKKGEKMITPGEGLLQPDGAWGPEVYQTLRQTTRRNVINENHHMQVDIKAYRQKVLGENNVKNAFEGDWKVIGLAQRNKGNPHHWKNLKQNKDECNHFMKRHKIICKEVNIEDKNQVHSYQQAVMHGALDGLIGIYGAQLTEAVWMKPGSLVVALLPWLHPDVNESKSVRAVKEVTPLGVIFSDSDLNHVGYPLQRQSAPDCKEQGKHETKCWQDHPWDSRDFEGTSESIVDAITIFFLANPTESCTEYQELAADKFVLYNIHCKTGIETVPSPQHFFWKQDLFDIPKFANYTHS